MQEGGKPPCTRPRCRARRLNLKLLERRANKLHLKLHLLAWHGVASRASLRSSQVYSPYCGDATDSTSGASTPLLDGNSGSYSPYHHADEGEWDAASFSVQPLPEEISQACSSDATAQLLRLQRALIDVRAALLSCGGELQTSAMEWAVRWLQEQGQLNPAWDPWLHERDRDQGLEPLQPCLQSPCLGGTKGDRASSSPCACSPRQPVGASRDSTVLDDTLAEMPSWLREAAATLHGSARPPPSAAAAAEGQAVFEGQAAVVAQPLPLRPHQLDLPQLRPTSAASCALDLPDLERPALLRNPADAAALIACCRRWALECVVLTWPSVSQRLALQRWYRAVAIVGASEAIAAARSQRRSWGSS